jgi:hypothetical protein
LQKAASGSVKQFASSLSGYKWIAISQFHDFWEIFAAEMSHGGRSSAEPPPKVLKMRLVRQGRARLTDGRR